MQFEGSAEIGKRGHVTDITRRGDEWLSAVAMDINYRFMSLNIVLTVLAFYDAYVAR